MALTLVFPTLLQLRQRTRFFIDEPVQANFTDSDLNWAINAAQQEVATEISLVDEKYFVATTPTVITTVGGQRFYPLVNDFWKMIRFEDVLTGTQLKFGDFSSQDNINGTTISGLVIANQISYDVAIVGNSIAFTPTPTISGLQAQYWYVPMLSDMLSDTDVSTVPRNFIDLVAIQAAIDAQIKDENDISPLTSKYRTRFNQLVRGTRDRQQQNPRGVTRVGEY